MAPKQLQLDAVLGALRAFHLQHGSWPKRKDARAGGDALARKVSVATKTWAGMSAPEKKRLRGNFAAEVQWLLREIPLGAGGHDPASGCRGRLRDVLRGLQVFHGEHGSWPKRGDPRRGADTLARKVGGLRNLWQQVSEEDRAELRAEFADEVAWLLGEDRPDVVCATLREGMDFHAKHGRHARRGRAGQVHKEDALAQRVGRAVRVARHREELRQQFGDFLESWTDADAALDAALEASRSALEEGVAFREQHARFPLRGREAKLEGEDSLARRIARAVLVAQQHEELRQQFGDFLESWTDADAALDATLEASRSALEEGVAFREQHARFPLRGREAKLEGEDSLAQRIARALLVAQQHEELRQQFGDFLESWTDADAALEASRSALEEGVAFREQHARFPRRGREAKLEGEDSLAQRIARAVLVAQQHEELRQQFGDFLESWTDADAALEASRSALEEGVAFREQHARFPRRGREAKLEGEDSLARRIARAVLVAQQHEELRQQFGDFLESWTDADAALEAAVQASRSALEEGVAFREQHGRHPRRGRQPELEAEDALAQRIQRGVCLAQQEESIALEFVDFLSSWTNEIVASKGSLADVFGGRTVLEVLEPLSCGLFCTYRYYVRHVISCDIDIFTISRLGELYYRTYWWWVMKHACVVSTFEAFPKT